jgi:hypothetical protein
MPEANLFLLFSRRLNALELRYMVSGSVAAIIYSEPRLTNDVVAPRNTCATSAPCWTHL